LRTEIQDIWRIARRAFHVGAIALAVSTAPLAVAALEPAMDPGIRSKAKRSTDEGLRYLRDQQEADGSWMGSVGVTSIALRAFLTSHRGYDVSDGAFMTKPVDFILGNVNEDGSISESIQNRNYNTATAIFELKLLDDPKLDEVIGNAQAFVTGLQLDEADEYTPDHKFYGGIGYGGDERPDLSNMYYAMEALHAVGLDTSDPVYARAVTFITRSQNNSETNDQSWAGDDGGFTYMPGYSPHGGTGSYGGMTHAGLISLIYSGIDKEDPRIQAAYTWIRNNYTLKDNPGAKNQQGLYYYYTAFAKAMAAYGETTVIDGDGGAHNWREDLATELLSRQGEDGAWINSTPRWWEGLKPLVTARAIIALNLAIEQ